MLQRQLNRRSQYYLNYGSTVLMIMASGLNLMGEHSNDFCCLCNAYNQSILIQ